MMKAQNFYFNKSKLLVDFSLSYSSLCSMRPDLPMILRNISHMPHLVLHTYQQNIKLLTKLIFGHSTPACRNKLHHQISFKRLFIVLQSSKQGDKWLTYTSL